MFRPIQKKVLSKKLSFLKRLATEQKIKKVIESFLSARRLLLPHTLTYNHQDQSIVVTANSKVVASELLLYLPELKNAFSKAHFKFKRIIIQ